MRFIKGHSLLALLLFAVCSITLGAELVAARQVTSPSSGLIDSTTEIGVPVHQELSTAYPARSLEADMELRRSLGFRSDRSYVVSIQASSEPVYNRRFSRVLLTPEESEELEVRMNLGEDVLTLEEHFSRKSQLRGALGGIYIENAAGSENHKIGGKLILQIVRSHPMATLITTTLPELQYPERLEFQFVEFSEEYLQNVYERLSETLSHYGQLNSVYIDRPANRVGVTIVPTQSGVVKENGLVDKASLPNELIQLLSDPAIIVQEGQARRTLTAVKGGQEWAATWPSGYSTCTLGFKVMDDDQYAMLSAGHCFAGMPLGQMIFFKSTQIGNFHGLYRVSGVSTNSPGAFDAGLFTLRTPSTAVDDVLHNKRAYDVIGSTGITRGEIYCWTGITSGTVCGPVTCDTVSYCSSTGVCFRDMATIDPPSSGGDSGAPVYRVEPIGRRVRVIGIQDSIVGSLGCTVGNDSELSKWTVIRDYFGLTLVTK